MPIDELLHKETFTKDDLVALLSLQGDDMQQLFKKALEVKIAHVGRKVYFRGLIEYSNRCSKNCYYCGIRSGNKKFSRYEMTDEEVIEAAMYAYQHQFASIVIQSGERSNQRFTRKIESLLKEICRLTHGEMHVTLSLGEQTEETYRRWFDAGAHRYLLRIEASNEQLYPKLHPADGKHDYQKRLEALRTLRRLGYQVGTGVMIGLPFQTLSDLADDLLFFRDFDVDMIGMGPYIEHEETPLYKYRDQLPPLKERLDLSLKMVAILRIMMKDINIAATTAMQAIDPQGREKALMAGANVMMPNLTPVKYRDEYLLYENKPCLDEAADQCRGCLETRILLSNHEVGYGEWGDSAHYQKRKKEE
ncbi:MAG TPA: [FeFe] hydrogenase H-cluster radical SAM maturase HydE [Bacteroidales bacterium]|nr:[FeFe] hydrogenase H-cluster radical SAM maturase HydE [Bacteroidales bacterium]HPS73808.1 [FeFe] hydrogenase H-cluster radical SAM maturase HydE [Bacteroidales bacterium]